MTACAHTTLASRQASAALCDNHLLGVEAVMVWLAGPAPTSCSCLASAIACMPDVLSAHKCVCSAQHLQAPSSTQKAVPEHDQ